MGAEDKVALGPFQMSPMPQNGIGGALAHILASHSNSIRTNAVSY